MRTIEVERLTRSLKDTMRQRDEAADEIERLRAENELIRRVLKPFADAADALDSEKWDDECIDGSSAVVTGLHCRNARAAMNLFRHK